jgi:bla regulator protein blaR1
MRSRRVDFARLLPLALLAVALVPACPLSGQSPAAPVTAPREFEVASVKLVTRPLDSGGGPWTVTHGRFKADAGWVRGVIAWAYNILAVQVRGGPDWIDSDRYDFIARTEGADIPPDQVRIMLQALLADRFKLTAHRETRELTAYTLVVGKNGSKMEEAKNGRRNFINWTGRGQVTFTECNLLGLVNVLSSTLGSPVVDKTELKGQYNFKLEYTDPRGMRPGSDGQLPTDSFPDIFGAVQQQLGLKLEAQKAPVETLVIDHIERPSEN